MEEAEPAFNFDFESGLDILPANTAPTIAIAAMATTVPATATVDASAVPPQFVGRRSFRQTVCRHWLRSLCMKGESCGFLHQYDKSRMPICRFYKLYGECRERDCVYKHTVEDIKECNMYKLGFCPNGPACRYRHAKLPGPPPPVVEVLQKIQQLVSYGYNAINVPNKFPNRAFGYFQQAEKPIAVPQASMGAQGLLGIPHQDGVKLQQQGQSQPLILQKMTQNLQHTAINDGNRSVIPLPQGLSRYFIVKSCNRENLELSVQQGMWATQRSNEAKLNEAFDSAENVILIFSVNRTRHFQGCAKMASRIGAVAGGGNWKYAHGTPHYGRNFSVKWLKLCELSFQKTRHLRNPYNENLPVKISRDCQELEPSIGEQLASLLCLEPNSELMAISIAAEAKREEEIMKGLRQDDGDNNPDIVPFEDGEEDEEEESDEDEGLSQTFPGGAQGRGMMWPQAVQMPIGARPMGSMQGFPPMMMGVDGYGLQDPYGIRGFTPYGPGFSSDFHGAGPGMMFSGRPMQPGNLFPGTGFGMIMGPNCGPYMGMVGPTNTNMLRGIRPGGMPFPMSQAVPKQPYQNNSHGGKRDRWSDEHAQRDPTGGPENVVAAGADVAQNKQHKLRSRAEPVAGMSSYGTDDSESDEAPRRSRHGEGRKRPRLDEERIHVSAK